MRGEKIMIIQFQGMSHNDFEGPFLASRNKIVMSLTGVNEE